MFAVVLKSVETIKVLASARDTGVFMLLLQSYFKDETVEIKNYSCV